MLKEHIQGGDGALDLNFEHNGTVFGGFVEPRGGGRADAVVVRDGSYAIARDFKIDDLESSVRAAADALASDPTDELVEEPVVMEVTIDEDMLTSVNDVPLELKPNRSGAEFSDNDEVGDDGKIDPPKTKRRRMRPRPEIDPDTLVAPS